MIKTLTLGLACVLILAVTQIGVSEEKPEKWFYGDFVSRGPYAPVLNRVAIKADLACGPDEKFNCRLVVQDHLRIAGRLLLGSLTQFDQPMCVEQRVSVAFKPA